MSDVAIRPATASDIHAITRIYAHAVRHGTASFEFEPPDEAEMTRRQRALLDGGYPYLVAEIDGTVVGYAYAGYQIGRLILDGVGGGRLSWLLAVPLGVALVVLVGLAPYVGGVLSVLVTVYGIGSLLFRPTLSAAAGPEKALVTREVEAPSAPGRPIVD